MPPAARGCALQRSTARLFPAAPPREQRWKGCCAETAACTCGQRCLPPWQFGLTAATEIPPPAPPQCFWTVWGWGPDTSGIMRRVAHTDGSQQNPSQCRNLRAAAVWRGPRLTRAAQTAQSDLCIQTEQTRHQHKRHACAPDTKRYLDCNRHLCTT